MSQEIDNVLQVTFAVSLSKHHRSLAATQSLVLIHNKVRCPWATGLRFRAWVIDSQTGLTGE